MRDRLSLICCALSNGPVSTTPPQFAGPSIQGSGMPATLPLSTVAWPLNVVAVAASACVPAAGMARRLTTNVMAMTPIDIGRVCIDSSPGDAGTNFPWEPPRNGCPEPDFFAKASSSGGP